MPTIGAVIIGQHEEVLLPTCLRSLKGIDEIFFTYTGDPQDTADKTIDIAKQFTDKLSYFRWCDSFCKARNAAKSYATTDWILSIDCDEVLHDYTSVREAVLLAEKQNAIAVDCTLIASDNGQQFFYPRLFKNSPEVEWIGNIHNHLSVEGKRLGNVRITHGYSPAHLLDPDRAYRILKKEVDNNPDAVREMFYLGREYFYRGEFESAVMILEKYVKRSNYLAEKAEAFLIMSRSYWKLSMAEEARDAILQALKINAHFKEAIIFMAVIAGKGTGNHRWEANASQWLKMAETANNEDVLFVRNNFDFR